MRESGRVDLSDLRPPLLGFDQLTSSILLLTNQVVALRMESNQTKAELIKGPVFPIEIVEDRLRRFATVKRTDVIAASQARWTRKNRR